MLNKLFLEHPKSVNETYTEHFIHAMGFSMTLQMAAFACFVHALVPAFFVKTGSMLINKLHRKMVVFRVKTDGSKRPLGDDIDESIEYMI
jgi:hypothetical protein